jgi:hypothetical protein
MLAPGVGLSVPLDILARLSPLRNRREASRNVGPTVYVRREPPVGCPSIQNNGLACWKIVEPSRGHAAIRRSEVFAIGEMMRVSREQIDCLAITSNDLNLAHHWIGLKINTHRDTSVLF